MLHRGLRTSRSAHAQTILLLAVATVFAGSGCSRLAVNNGSMDYQKANSIPPLNIPADEKTRQIVPLYPVPTVQPNDASRELTLTNRKGNRFEMPAPKPLDTANVGQDQTGVGAPSAPELVIDGNGLPILKITGDAPKIWDAINRTLSLANLNVTKRNPASNRFELGIDGKTYQLRLGRIGNVTTVTLQNTDETLADKTVASDVMNRIVQNWSA